ncbi:MAG: DUF1361 domain-containing protein [Bacteroidota bacterium]
MESLKTLILNRFKLFLVLTASMALSLVLLMVRMKLNQSFYLLFLVWNLFLALIPFLITLWLRSSKNLNWLSLIPAFVIWMLFLPNAPYIVTDLLHLRNAEIHLMWLDVLVITSFAFNGLALFYISVSDMNTILKCFLRPKSLNLLMFTIFGATAFGIYLGRFLRYNSWEIVNNPFSILKNCTHLIFKPNVEAWIFTLTFGAFLWVSYQLLNVFGSKYD